MLLEFPYVADPPDVIPDPVAVLIGIFKLPPRKLLAKMNGLLHGTMGMTTAAYIVDFCDPGGLKEMPKGVDEIEGMDVVPNLFPLVPEDAIRTALDRALHQIG